MGSTTSTAARTRLVALLLVWGCPLWWALGVLGLVPLIGAALAAAQLLRGRHRVHLPSGITWWLLFLAVVAMGVLVLAVDAPGAASGGDGFGRLLVFGYRLSWYTAVTILLVWLGNASREVVSDRFVLGLVGGLFVVATAGGFVGLLAPHFEFTSALEAALPGGLRTNSFVRSLVHPEAADVQQVLGRAEARPKAPFAFTNTWGSVIALSGVFLVAWAHHRGLAARVGVAVVFAAATVPVVFSLNRGLWTCVALGVVGAALIVVRRGRLDHLLVGGLVTAVLALALAGPLVATVQERFEHQHSNDRRGSLASATVASVTEGSPVVGFGTTRDVQGSFASISGGATPGCPACGVPPLGTQGHLWLVLFSQGWLGLMMFCGFFATAIRRCWRCRTPNETVALFVLGFFAVQVFVYDTLGLPLLLVMLAIGLVWREQREQTTTGAGWTVAQLMERARRGAPVAMVLASLGLGVGWWSGVVGDRPEQRTEVRLALTTPVDPYSPTVIGDLVERGDADRRDLRITIDTEAALLLSEQTLAEAVTLTDDPRHTPTPQDLRDTISLRAEPLTQILVLTVRAPDAQESHDRALAVAAAYLTARQDWVEHRRGDLLARLHDDLRRVLPTDPTTATLLLRLNTVDRRLRADAPSVGRVVNVSGPEPVAHQRAVRSTSGLALGLVCAIGAGRLLHTPTPHRRRRR